MKNLGQCKLETQGTINLTKANWPMLKVLWISN